LELAAASKREKQVKSGDKICIKFSDLCKKHAESQLDILHKPAVRALLNFDLVIFEHIVECKPGTVYPSSALI